MPQRGIEMASQRPGKFPEIGVPVIRNSNYSGHANLSRAEEIF